MEAARLGLSDYGCGAGGGIPRLGGLGLPVDPWLAPPLLTALPGKIWSKTYNCLRIEAKYGYKSLSRKRSFADKLSRRIYGHCKVLV